MLTNGVVPEVRQTDNSTIVPAVQLGNSLAASPGEGLALIIQDGIAWIDGAYLRVRDTETLHLNPGINDIVARLDTTGSQVVYKLFVKPRSTGTLVENLTRSEGIYELGLHTVTVPTGTSQVTASMIEDHRLDLTPGLDGKPICGIVGSLLQPDVSAWYDKAAKVLHLQQETFAQLMEDQKKDFQAWFDSLQVILDGDVAANLAGEITAHKNDKGMHTFPATASLTSSGALELTGDLPADKDGLTVQFVSPAAATDGLQMKFAGSDALYPILTTGEGKEPIQAGAWDQGVPVTLTVSGGSCFFKGGGAGFPAGWSEKGQGIAWDDITKNSPIVQREYGKIEDGLQALPEPDVLPTRTGVGCAFSPDNNYLAVSHSDSPYITIYKRSGDTFTKLPNPSALPTGNAYGCAFSPDNNYLAIANTKSPCITIYLNEQKTYVHTLNDINKEYFAYAPKGKIGVAKESKPAGELVQATLFPALYNLTDEGGN
nr:MAG TPA: methylamine dehydrogenase heavy chain [Caudoviricetes sp.]